MSTVDRLYQDMIFDCLAVGSGSDITTRNSKVRRIRNRMLTFSSTPLVYIRKTAWKNCLREWEWFMSGSNFLFDLHLSVKDWWSPWAEENGEIHFHYGKQFRHFSGDCGNVDSVGLLVEGVKNHPFSRRNVITTWNTSDMNHSLCRLTTCHGTVIQAFVEPDNSLHLTMYQRSCDLICGVPHNWLQYWAFLLWLAHKGGRKVGTFTWIGGDVHVYEAHRGLAERMLDVKVEEEIPQLVYSPSSEDFLAEDFSLDRPYSPVLLDKAEMIV